MYEPKPPARDYAIFDLDGTIANIDHRLHYLKPKCSNCGNEGRLKLPRGYVCTACQAPYPRPDWNLFFEGMDDDSPNEEIIKLARWVSDYADIIVCTGRPTRYQERTAKWLFRYDLKVDMMLMRPDDSTAPDFEIKSDMLDKLLNLYRKGPVFVVDDRQSVVDMWRARGVRCLQCAAWPEF